MALYYFSFSANLWIENCPVLPHWSSMCLNILSIHLTRLVFQHFAKGIQFKASHICSAQLKPGDQCEENSENTSPPRPFPALLAQILSAHAVVVPTYHPRHWKTAPRNTKVRLPSDGYKRRKCPRPPTVVARHVSLSWLMNTGKTNNVSWLN